LLDCELLKEVYINLLDQKSPKFNFKNSEFINEKNKDENNNTYKNNRKIIKPSEEEMKLHKNYLKTSLQKNFFN